MCALCGCECCACVPSHDLLVSTPALVEMQSGAETDIMVEVQDAGGNVITAHGAIVGEATGFQQVRDAPL